MSDYISREAAKAKKVYSSERHEYVVPLADLDWLPAADVRPVVRGKWVLDSDPGEPWKYRCDQCGGTTTDTCMGEPRASWCPLCGADMREDKRE